MQQNEVPRHVYEGRLDHQTAGSDALIERRGLLNLTSLYVCGVEMRRAKAKMQRKART